MIVAFFAGAVMLGLGILIGAAIAFAAFDKTKETDEV